MYVDKERPAQRRSGRNLPAAATSRRSSSFRQRRQSSTHQKQRKVVADQRSKHFSRCPAWAHPLLPRASATSGPWQAQSLSVIVTELIVTSSFGLPDWVPMASIAATTSRPSMTFPNREYWGGRRTPLGPLMTKN